MRSDYMEKEKSGCKLVIIINGKGGSGKDTLCEIASRHYSVLNVSSIDPIKAIARRHGWNEEKDERSRKFLSDLKRAFTDFNELPNKYLKFMYREFMESQDELMFVHIREGDQIDAFKWDVWSPCVTLLVRSVIEGVGADHYGNDSDDLVEDYKYDYIYTNSKPLSELEQDFMPFLNNIINDYKGGGK